MRSSHLSLVKEREINSQVHKNSKKNHHKPLLETRDLIYTLDDLEMREI